MVLMKGLMIVFKKDPLDKQQDQGGSGMQNEGGSAF